MSQQLRRFCAAIALLVFAVHAFGAGPLVRPDPAVRHVIIVSIDGMRPDVALRAQMPTLRGLMEHGAFTFWARTTAVSITLPSHTSMVTGVPPDEHGITWNYDVPLREPIYPERPTVMEMATRAGLSTAMVAGKSKFAALDKPGTIGHVFVPPGPDRGVDDATVTAYAEEFIGKYKPDLLLVHFPGADTAGHGKGWGSPAQIGALENIDRQLARLVAAVDKAGLRDSTVFIISADHGGTALSHGADDVRSRHIPWIISGPGVRPGYDLTRVADLEVRTEDTAATACYVLGLPQQKYFVGKPVLAAFERSASR